MKVLSLVPSTRCQTLFILLLVINFTMKPLKVLLIQLRNDLYTKQDEYLRFLRAGRLRPAQLDVWDVFHESVFDETRLADYDVVVMGGSSDDPDDEVYFTQEKYPFTDSVLSVVRTIKESKQPFLASCMGFHMVNQALGGEIVIDVAGRESGAYEFTLTEEGQQDPLFSELPGTFPVVSYHKKRAVKIPDGMINLGSTELCPYQAIRYPDRPFYAFQFHPELDKATVIEWSRRYAEKYYLTDEFIADMEANFPDTSVASSLIGRFLKHTFPGRA